MLGEEVTCGAQSRKLASLKPTRTSEILRLTNAYMKIITLRPVMTLNAPKIST